MDSQEHFVWELFEGAPMGIMGTSGDQVGSYTYRTRNIVAKCFTAIFRVSMCVRL